MRTVDNFKLFQTSISDSKFVGVDELMDVIAAGVDSYSNCECCCERVSKLQKLETTARQKSSF
jgi:hypothetical protein